MQNLIPLNGETEKLSGSDLDLGWHARIKVLLSLFKPRIVMLLLISAAGGAVLGAHGWPGATQLLLLLITGGLSSAGVSAINQYLERDRDSQMVRTRQRALPSGIIKKSVWVLVCGSVMVAIALLVSAVYNPALAISNALGALIYIGIYTIWLKPRTILNIVIGGAAGSMAVVSGGAAVHAWNDPGVLVLALLVFAWTPTHFWSLSMAYRKDYTRAGFPMLPVNTTMKQAAWWVAIHTFATGLIAVILGLNASLGIGYLVPVILLTIHFMRLTLQLVRAPEGKEALALFKFSNIYLGIVQLMIIFLPLFR